MQSNKPLQANPLQRNLRLRRRQSPLLPFSNPPLLTLTKPIPEQLQMRPHQNGVLHKLLHTIHQPVPIRTRHQPRIPRASLIGELRVRLRDGGLVRDREHPHPPAQDPEGVHRVEGLRAAADLRDGQGAALRWSYASCA